jgi:hypothetical protein
MKGFERIEQRRREALERAPLTPGQRKELAALRAEARADLAKHRRWLSAGLGSADPGKLSKLDRKIRRAAGMGKAISKP